MITVFISMIQKAKEKLQNIVICSLSIMKIRLIQQRKSYNFCKKWVQVILNLCIREQLQFQQVLWNLRQHVSRVKGIKERAFLLLHNSERLHCNQKTMETVKSKKSTLLWTVLRFSTYQFDSWLLSKLEGKFIQCQSWNFCV